MWNKNSMACLYSYISEQWKVDEVKMNENGEKKKKKMEKIKSTELNGGSKFLFIHSFAFSFVCQAAADVFELLGTWMSLHVAGEFPLNSTLLLLNVRINFLSCTAWTHTFLFFFHCRLLLFCHSLNEWTNFPFPPTQFFTKIFKAWLNFNFLIPHAVKMLKNKIIWQINGLYFSCLRECTFLLFSFCCWCWKYAHFYTHT